MTDDVIACGPFFSPREGRHFHLGGDAIAPHEQVEMAMLALFRAVRVIIILPIGIVIEDVAIGIMIPLIKGALVLDDLADNIGRSFFQNPITFHDLPTGGGHYFQPFSRQVIEQTLPIRLSPTPTRY